MDKRLYISDLDGTLLTSRQEIAPRDIDTLNELIGRGMRFTVATARSYDSVRNLVSGLRLELPMILNNGALVYDPAREEYIMKRLIPSGSLEQIMRIFRENGVSFFTHVLEGPGECKCMYRGIFNEFEEIYVTERLRRGDKRFVLCDPEPVASRLECAAISAFNTQPVIKRMIRRMRGVPGVTCHFYADSYSDGYIIEVTEASADKRTGVEFLRKHLDASHVTCFGDNFNDIGMLAAADTRCVVKNAVREVISRANVIIGTNEEGGVAAYLRENFLNM